MFISTKYRFDQMSDSVDDTPLTSSSWYLSNLERSASGSGSSRKSSGSAINLESDSTPSPKSIAFPMEHVTFQAQSSGFSDSINKIFSKRRDIANRELNTSFLVKTDSLAVSGPKCRESSKLGQVTHKENRVTFMSGPLTRGPPSEEPVGNDEECVARRSKSMTTSSVNSGLSQSVPHDMFTNYASFSHNQTELPELDINLNIEALSSRKKQLRDELIARSRDSVPAMQFDQMDFGVNTFEIRGDDKKNREIDPNFMVTRRSLCLFLGEMFPDQQFDYGDLLVQGRKATVPGSVVRAPLYDQRLTMSGTFLRMQEEKAMAAIPKFAIDASRLFLSYVQERRKKPVLFKGELLVINKSFEHHKCDYASSKELESKNNYPDVLPFDYNRVVLSELPSCSHSDYINASYVDSFYKQKAYVVTQSVKTKATCIDFWRMIWELESNCIVMLTKVFDYMKVMCLQYWPLSSAQYGDIKVELLSTKNYANLVIRTLRISKSKYEPRLLTHFHYTEWEANGWPYISALLDLRRRVRRHLSATQSKGPVVVHCSDGAERSGVYLAVDANLEFILEEKMIDVFGYGKILVNARPGLMRSLEHYMFIYDVLAEAVQCTIEPFPMHELKTRSTLYLTKKSRQAMETKQSAEYKLLGSLTPQLMIGDCAGGHRLENRGKNRDVMVVPPDYARPYLSTLQGDSKDYTYINAVNIDGFTRKNEWIVTEWPKQNTTDSLWALIFDHNCHTLVNLTSSPKNRKTYPPFIHHRGRQVYGPFIVEVISYQSYPYMTSHIVKVMKRTFVLTEVMSSTSFNLLDTDFKVCNVVSVRMWPLHNRVPQSTSGFVDVIRMVRSWRKRAPDKPETRPSIVLSHTGVTRCGIFVAANIIIDQMELDQECDFFHACKVIRLNRPQLIDNKEEYKYLFDLMLHYYITDPEYQKMEKNGPIVSEAKPYPVTSV